MQLKDLPPLIQESFHGAITTALGQARFFRPEDRTLFTGDMRSERHYALFWTSPDQTLHLKYDFVLEPNGRIFSVDSSISLFPPGTGVTTERPIDYVSEGARFYIDEIADVVNVYTQAASILVREGLSLNEGESFSDATLQCWMTSFHLDWIRPVIRADRPPHITHESMEIGDMADPKCASIGLPFPFVILNKPPQKLPAEMHSTSYVEKLKEAHKKLSKSGWDDLVDERYAKMIMRCKAQGYALIMQQLSSSGLGEVQIVEEYKITQDQLKWLMQGRLDKFTIEQINELIIRAGYDYDIVFNRR